MTSKKQTPKDAKPKRGDYEKPLQVKGSFMDIMKAAVKDADKKTPKKEAWKLAF